MREVYQSVGESMERCIDNGHMRTTLAHIRGLGYVVAGYMRCRPGRADEGGV